MALYVSNPRRKSAKKSTGGKTRRKAKSVRRRSKARAHQARVENSSHKRTRRKASKRTSSRRRVARVSNPPPARRRRTSRAMTRRRANGRGVSWRRAKGGVRRGKRRTIRRRRVQNALTLSNPMGGGMVSSAFGMVLPAFFGALGVEAVGQTIRVMAESEMVNEWVPEGVKRFTAPIAYTIGGLIFGAVVQAFTFIPAGIRQGLGIAAVSAGGGVDWYRYRQASGALGDLQLGDAGEWYVEYGGTDDDDEDDDDDEHLGDLAFGALELGDFAGDEDHCPPDFSVAEGQTMYEGFGAWRKRYPFKKGQKTRGVEGHRFNWLLKEVGPAEAQRLAKMPPDERKDIIAQLKERVRARRQRRAEHAGGPGPRRQLPQNPDRMDVTPESQGPSTVEFETAGASY